MTMLIAIQRRLDIVQMERSERLFLMKSVKHLRTVSGRQTVIADWEMTSFDVHSTQSEPIAWGG